MARSAWRWEEGAVDKTLEHLEIACGDISTRDTKDVLPVALVSAPNGITFTVQFLIGASSPENRKMFDAVRKELALYLVELSGHGRPEPWEYAKYHCTTAANAYSNIHWSYHLATTETKG